MKTKTMVLLAIGGYAFYRAGGVYYLALLNPFNKNPPSSGSVPVLMPDSQPTPICIDNCAGTTPNGSLNPAPPMVGIPVRTPIATQVTPTRVGMSGYIRTRR